MEDLHLGEELILDAGCRISLHDSLLAFTNCLSPLLIQLFLEVGEHLEKLTFSEKSCLELVGPHLRHGSSEGVLFTDVCDVNARAERRVDDPRAPSSQ